MSLPKTFKNTPNKEEGLQKKYISPKKSSHLLCELNPFWEKINPGREKRKIQFIETTTFCLQHARGCARTSLGPNLYLKARLIISSS